MTALPRTYERASPPRVAHAGLLGADVLIVVDEARLVPPFEALLWRIAKGAEQFGSCAESDVRLVPPLKPLPQEGRCTWTLAS